MIDDNKFLVEIFIKKIVHLHFSHNLMALENILALHIHADSKIESIFYKMYKSDNVLGET